MHYYGFWPFSVNIAGKHHIRRRQPRTTWSSTSTAWYNTFISKGIPVILGEYGLLSYDYTRPGVIEPGEVKKFFEELGYQARTKRVTTMLWDAGSFLNRNTLQWRDAGPARPDQVELDDAVGHRVERQGVPAEVRRDHQQDADAEPERHHVPGAAAGEHRSGPGH